MTYNEIVTEVKKYFAGKKAAGNKKHFAAEVEITDGGGGVFCIEFDGENINVEDKSYPKKDVRLITDTDTFIKVAIEETLPPEKALAQGKLKLENDLLDVPKAIKFGSLVAKAKQITEERI